MPLPFLTCQQWRETELRRHQEYDLLVDCFCVDGCDRCEYSCQIHFLDLPDRDQEIYFSRERYKYTLLDDARALAEWTGRNMIEMLVEMGFHPYTVVRWKRLEIDL